MNIVLTNILSFGTTKFLQKCFLLIQTSIILLKNLRVLEKLFNYEMQLLTKKLLSSQMSNYDMKLKMDVYVGTTKFLRIFLLMQKEYYLLKNVRNITKVYLVLNECLR